MKERFMTFLGLIGSLFAIVAGVLISQRVAELSNETLSLAGGMLFGCAVGMVPVALILAVGWFALKWREAGASRHTQVQQPPVIIVAGGQALPYQQQTLPPALPAEWRGEPAPRTFTVIGED
ncbi:MAG: hypothetical protein RBT75_09940 [Anaerolineae bacterium]|jgi:hypothetical protein|nr:hypothetical protein [Anaerolineae bacterium]